MAIAATSTIGSTMIKMPTGTTELPFGVQRTAIFSPVAGLAKNSSGSGDSFYCATCGGPARYNTSTSNPPGRTTGTYTSASLCPTCGNAIGSAGKLSSLGGASGLTSGASVSPTSASLSAGKFSSIGAMISSVVAPTATTTLNSTGYKWF